MKAAARKIVLSACALLGGWASASAAAGEYVDVPAGSFRGVLTGNFDPDSKVARFSMRVTPVTNAEFLQFVLRHPRWRRGAAPSLLADADYLAAWAAPTELGARVAAAGPVTRVSWFAAQAYCEDEGGRLPTWLEWEYVAAADATRKDARADPAWRARILAWYGSLTDAETASVGGEADAYGVRNMHGLVWEWVEDFNGLLLDADSRVQGDAEKLRFCGAGALTMKDREDYALLMRIALLTSLEAAGSTANLGFRCVRPFTEAAP